MFDGIRTQQEMGTAALLWEIMEQNDKLFDGDSEREFVLWQLDAAMKAGRKQ
jgi:hypothetical protein